MVIKIIDTDQIRMWLEEEVYDVNFVYHVWSLSCVGCMTVALRIQCVLFLFPNSYLIALTQWCLLTPVSWCFWKLYRFVINKEFDFLLTTANWLMVLFMFIKVRISPCVCCKLRTSFLSFNLLLLENWEKSTADEPQMANLNTLCLWTSYSCANIIAKQVRRIQRDFTMPNFH